MLIVKEVRERVEGIWFYRKICGETIGYKIRPRSETIEKEIREEQKKFGPSEIADALLDYWLEDFAGLGDEKGTPWSVTAATKRKAISLPLPQDEQPIYEWLLDKAAALSFDVAKEEKGN